jgi:hypothetical protein
MDQIRTKALANGVVFLGGLCVSGACPRYAALLMLSVMLMWTLLLFFPTLIVDSNFLNLDVFGASLVLPCGERTPGLISSSKC